MMGALHNEVLLKIGAPKSVVGDKEDVQSRVRRGPLAHKSRVGWPMKSVLSPSNAMNIYKSRTRPVPVGYRQTSAASHRAAVSSDIMSRKIQKSLEYKLSRTRSLFFILFPYSFHRLNVIISQDQEGTYMSNIECIKINFTE